MEAAIVEKTLSVTDSIFAAMFLLACAAAGYLIKIIIKGADRRDAENRAFIKEQSEIIKIQAKTIDNFDDSLEQMSRRIDGMEDNIKEIRTDVKVIKEQVRT